MVTLIADFDCIKFQARHWIDYISIPNLSIMHCLLFRISTIWIDLNTSLYHASSASVNQILSSYAHGDVSYDHSVTTSCHRDGSCDHIMVMKAKGAILHHSTTAWN